MKVKQNAGVKPYQFSVRAAMVGTTVAAICLGVALVRFRRVQTRGFVETSIRPITDNYVSSVGYAHGRILWLRANGIDPHHSNGVDQWVVPIEMNMYRNDGSFGPYQTFDDLSLRRFVSDHRGVRAIDLRGSAVTDVGLRCLGELRQLEWLWLDSSQSSAGGLAHLHGSSSLRTIVLDLNAADLESVNRLREAIPGCRVVDRIDEKPSDR